MSRYTKIMVILPKHVSESVRQEVGNITSKRALKKLIASDGADVRIHENLLGDSFKQEK